MKLLIRGVRLFGCILSFNHLIDRFVQLRNLDGRNPANYKGYNRLFDNDTGFNELVEIELSHPVLKQEVLAGRQRIEFINVGTAPRALGEHSLLHEGTKHGSDFVAADTEQLRQLFFSLDLRTGCIPFIENVRTNSLGEFGNGYP